MDRDEGAGREHGALHPLLTASFDERAQVGEVPELGAIHGALGADWEGRADLRDHDTDLTRWHLRPREPLHAEYRPELEAQTGHAQRRLVTGFAAVRAVVVFG